MCDDVTKQQRGAAGAYTDATATAANCSSEEPEAVM